MCESVSIHSRHVAPLAEFVVLLLKGLAAFLECCGIPKGRSALVFEGAYFRSQGHLAGGALGPLYLMLTQSHHLEKNACTPPDGIQAREMKRGNARAMALLQDWGTYDESLQNGLPEIMQGDGWGSRDTCTNECLKSMFCSQSATLRLPRIIDDNKHEYTMAVR